MELGNKIRSLRLKQKINIEQLSEKTGLSKGFCHNISLMHLITATIIPIIIIGISKSPIPKGINKIITNTPATAPIIVNNTFSSTAPIFMAATIKIKNIINPNNISIISPTCLKYL